MAESNGFPPLLGPKLKKALVRIMVCLPCLVGAKWKRLQASGYFVSNNIVATNRHVISGPATYKYVITHDGTHVPIEKSVGHPVHDWLLIYLKFIPENIHILPLRPELLTEGKTVFMAGNNEATVFNISTGIVSRLECDTPKYDTVFQDFNAPYAQCTLQGRGGSSGSPIFVIHADDIVVVAMQSAGHEDTKLFQQLDEMKEGLSALQKGSSLPQYGELGVVFGYRHLSQLPEGAVAEVKGTKRDDSKCLFAESTWMPTEIEPGDVLLEIDGAPVFNLTEYNVALRDRKKEETVHVAVIRDEKRMELEVELYHLSDLVPHETLWLSQSTSIHELGPTERVKFGNQSGLFVEDWQLGGHDLSGRIITRVNGKERGLKDLMDMLKNCGEDLELQHMHPSAPESGKWTTTISRSSLVATTYCVHFGDGKWDYVPLELMPPKPTPPICVQLKETSCYNGYVHRLRLVCSAPYWMDEIPTDETFLVEDGPRRGYGYVVGDGIILAPKLLVAHSNVNVTITLNDGSKIQSKGVTVHPYFSFVRFDSTLCPLPILPLGDIVEPNSTVELHRGGTHFPAPVGEVEITFAKFDKLDASVPSCNFFEGDLAGRDFDVAISSDHVQGFNLPFHNPGENAVYKMVPAGLVKRALEYGENSRVYPAVFQDVHISEVLERLPENFDKNEKHHPYHDNRFLQVTSAAPISGLHEGDLVRPADTAPFVFDIVTQEQVHVEVIRDKERLAVVVPTIPSQSLVSTEVADVFGFLAFEAPLDACALFGVESGVVVRPGREGHIPESTGDRDPWNFDKPALLIKFRRQQIKNMGDFLSTLRSLSSFELVNMTVKLLSGVEESVCLPLEKHFPHNIWNFTNGKWSKQVI